MSLNLKVLNLSTFKVEGEPCFTYLLCSGRQRQLTGPTTTLGTDVSWLMALGYGTAFQLVLGNRTSAMNSLSSYRRHMLLKTFLGVEIASHCDYICFNCTSPNFLTYLLTYITYRTTINST